MTKQILFVDDEPKILQGFVRQLNTRFHMQTAPDPEEGLKRVRHNGPFAVVVADFRMPGMNGIDVCRAIRTESGVPIVMLTARHEAEARIEGLQIGADDYVTKPFGTRELRARMRREPELAADAAAAARLVGDAATVARWVAAGDSLRGPH